MKYQPLHFTAAEWARAFEVAEKKLLRRRIGTDVEVRLISGVVTIRKLPHNEFAAIKLEARHA